MNNNVIKPLLTGFLGLSLVASAAFLPWFQWAYQEEADIWYGSSSLSGPPAIVLGAPYATVKALSNDLEVVDSVVGAYLMLFLGGIALWAGLLWMMRQEVRRWIVIAGGVGTVAGWTGLVLALELADLIAQRTGVYAATATDRIVVAELERFQLLGPSLAVLGIGVELGAISLLLRRRREIA